MSSNGLLQVQLDKFEGPLSLLLYLIRKNELDIYDIPIHEITKQYLEYIQVMKEFNLEVAGEFIAMAATLILIKSRMLVPQYNEEGEVVQEDPRKELVQKLLEYQKFKLVAETLNKRPLRDKDVWTRGHNEDLFEAAPESGIILDERGLFALIAAYRDLVKKAKPESVHTVRAKGMSISARMIHLQNYFIPGNRIELKDLLEENYTKTDLLVTFLSLLELARLQYIRIFQTEPYAPLHIETVRAVDRDIVSRVQEFDATSSQAEAMAEKLFQTAEKQLELGEGIVTQEPMTPEILDNDPEIQAVESGKFDEGEEQLHDH